MRRLLSFIAGLGATAALAGGLAPGAHATAPGGLSLFPAPDAALAQPAPSSHELSAQLRQSTGLSASQVTVANLCPSPTRGRVSCDAEALILRSNHHLVRPRVGRRHAGAVIRPADDPAPASTSSPPLAHTPAWLQQAYDLVYASQNGGASSTIAVTEVGDDPTAEQDLATYRSAYGLPACTTANGCFRKVNQTGQQGNYPTEASESWQTESALDVDAISALCARCHILLVEANTDTTSDLDTAMSEAVTLGATEISDSWSSNSATPPAGTYTFPGVAVIASTGDHGYVGSSVNAFPAALPGVTAVGGTNLAPTTTATATPRGFTDSGWALSSDNWGASSGCDTAETKPTWQTDTGCTGRAYADVSADADPYTGLNVYATAASGWILMGGTSLSAPLVAAYEAVTGINGSSPSWAYSDSAYLSDPVLSENGITPGGTNGSCAAAILYICNTGVGYDGPTGEGAILGDIAPGSPGIGGPGIGGGNAGTGNSYTQSVTRTTATLTGGVFPNNLDTSYYWQYGTSTAYGQQTTPTDIGSGSAAVATTDTLSGLTPGTTYDYRLVAVNSDGVTYGYNFTFTTQPAGAIPPVNITAPTLSGTITQGQLLSSTTGAWSPTPTGYTYTWRRSSDGTNWTTISTSSPATYDLAAADVGDYLDVVVTATNAYGSAQATSNTLGPIASAAPVNVTPPSIVGTIQRGQTLTASASWSPSNVLLNYQWQRSTDGGTTWANIPGATNASYSLQASDEGTMVQVIVTATNNYGHVTLTSPDVGPINSAPPTNTVAPTLSGNASRGATLTVANGTWSGYGNAYLYLWQRSADGGTTWGNIPADTSSSYTLQQADEGDVVRVLVTAKNVDGTATVATAATSTIAASPPQSTGVPTITGQTSRGSVLTATQGTWSVNGNAMSYQWQRSADGGTTWTNITGATGLAYLPAVADEGDVLRIVVTATNVDGNASAASAATATVTSSPAVNTTTPTVSGTPERSMTLTGTQGSWTGNGNIYAFQWQSSANGGTTWTNIAGATGLAYTPVAADEGHELRLVVTGINADGSVSAPSAATAAVASAAPVNLTPPTVGGTPMRGMTLAGKPGTWSGMTNAYTYQWQRGSGSTWTNISGATSPAYAVAVADEGSQLRLQMTAVNPDGTITAVSAPTAVAVASPPHATTGPTLIGTLTRGLPETVSAGAWSGLNNSYAYQWERSADSGTTWTNISGATSTTYTPPVGDEGDELRVQVTVTNPDATVVLTTAASHAVSASPPVNVSPPAVGGTARRGVNLSAGRGSWSGVGNTYVYQWQRSVPGSGVWTNISGASTSVYATTTADVGDTLRVTVTATNPDASVSASSAGTATISSGTSSSGAINQLAVASSSQIRAMIADAAGDAVVSAGAVEVRAAGGQTLLSAQLEGSSGATADIVAAVPGDRLAGGRSSATRTLRLRPATRASRRLRAWVCQAAAHHGMRLCLPAVRLGSGRTLRVPARMTGALRIGVVRPATRRTAPVKRRTTSVRG